MFKPSTIPEEQVYEILANRRRRETIRELTVSARSSPISLHDLSKEVAKRETGERPPPSSVRESVYNSLHQTHLPRLHDLGVVQYDQTNRTVILHERARDLDRHMDAVTSYGITWGEIYRIIGVLSLSIVLATLLEVPAISSVDPLLWTSFFLFIFTAVIGIQLWSNRWILVRAFPE